MATNPAGVTPAVTVVPDEPTENVRYLPTQVAPGTVPPNPHAADYDGVATPEPVDRPEPAGPPIPLHPGQTPAGRPRIVDSEADSYAAEIAATLASRSAGASGGGEHVDQIEPMPAVPIDRQPTEVDSTLAARSEYEPPDAFGTHGPLPLAHELVPLTPVDDNPFGDFFSDGPSAWLEDDLADRDEPSVEITDVRVKGTLLAFGAISAFVLGWAWVIAAMVRGSGGAEAGGFVLLGMVFWCGYLSLDRTDQHHRLLTIDRRIAGMLDRGVQPLQTRTTGTLALRRERDRYRAMREERTRRIQALGEGAYRSFRRGKLPAELHDNAQRVLAMERQMMLQDHRIHEMVRQRDAVDGSD
ncbi:MAG: hypothetical protein JWN41_574 [Thermoleophilia bacterium]|nr:hypothetical protein [Thermoleophilia bacterium]